MTGLKNASKAELTSLIASNDARVETEIFDEAAKIRANNFGNRVYLRGLIEITSYCKNDCYYCGLRRSNKKALRYRLTDEQILNCCETGYNLGFRTFVLQGGEDAYFADDELCELVSKIKSRWPDAAITLSMGERDKDSYRRLLSAGAERYLLRHETASDEHYALLHPEKMSLSSRKKCLYDLKEAGFQTGAGFMVGSPFQKPEHLAEDLLFLRDLQPHMVGIGPFIPHIDTPFGECSPGGIALTLKMIALTRILLPCANLPATTALATLAPDGRERGFACGANVAMPNLSPPEVRGAYNLYNGKLATGAEAAEGLRVLKEKLAAAGYVADMSRGDAKEAN